MRSSLLLLATVALSCSAKGTTPPPVVSTTECDKATTGLVTLAIESDPIEQSRGTASFTEETVSSLAPRCTNKTVGSCIVSECVRADVPVPGAPACAGTVRVTGAGTITIAGGAKPSLTMTSDAKRAYAGFSSSGARWAPGDTVNVSAAGGEVAAFNASVVFPSRVEVKTPPEFVAKKDPIDVDWRAGYALTWTPGVGTVSIYVSQGDPELRKRTTIDCKVPSSDGKFTIPSEALQFLEGTNAASKTANAYLDVAGVADTKVTAGAYEVTVRALHLEARRNLIVRLEGIPAK